VGVSGSDEA